MRKNKDFHNKIFNRCQELELKENAKVVILSPVASLKLFEEVFASPEPITTKNDIESQISLFKAYLLIVSKSTKRSMQNRHFLNTFPENVRSTLITLSDFPASEYINYNLGTLLKAQIVKSYVFFRFIESNEKSNHLLKAFCEQYGISHWKEYLSLLAPILFAYSERKNKDSWTNLSVPKNEHFDRVCIFLDSLCMQEYDETFAPDFITLRSGPLFKIEEGLYRIIFILFVVEKIFKALFFNFKQLNINAQHPNKFITDFRSFYTTEFSEHYLMTYLLDYVYEKKHGYKIIKGRNVVEENSFGIPIIMLEMETMYFFLKIKIYL